MKRKIEKLELLRIKRATLENFLARMPRKYKDEYARNCCDWAYTNGENSMIDQIRDLIHKTMLEYTPDHVDQVAKEKFEIGFNGT